MALRLDERLLTPYVGAAPALAHTLHTLVRLGQTDRVETLLAELDVRKPDTAFMRTVIAALRLGGFDPIDALAFPAPGRGHRPSARRAS